MTTTLALIRSRRAPATTWLAGLATLVLAGGCAERRPMPLVVHNGYGRTPVAVRNSAIVDLRLVTFNIWGLPSWMTGASPGRYPRISRELERLEPDIATLQEVWTGKAREALPHGRGWSAAWGACGSSFFHQSGLITLSRYPIVAGQFYPFHKAAFPDALVRKGVLKTTLELPGGHLLNIWNVHLQAGNAGKVRLSQIMELAARVRAADDGQIADIVAGDFNSTPDSPEYELLVQQVGPTAQSIGRSALFTTYDGLSSKPGNWETLDHIFIRSRPAIANVWATSRVAFTARNVKDRLSDHFGVEGSLSFELAPELDRRSAFDSLAAHAGSAVFR